jgi:hypothetical protein
LSDLIALAKSQFPLHKFVTELAGLDAVKLKSLADKRLVGFVERLIGRSIDKLNDTEPSVTLIQSELQKLNTLTSSKMIWSRACENSRNSSRRNSARKLSARTLTKLYTGLTDSLHRRPPSSRILQAAERGAGCFSVSIFLGERMKR